MALGKHQIIIEVKIYDCIPLQVCSIGRGFGAVILRVMNAATECLSRWWIESYYSSTMEILYLLKHNMEIRAS